MGLGHQKGAIDVKVLEQPAVAASGSPAKGSLRGRLVSGSLLNLVALGFNQGSTLVASVFVARILGRDAFGDYTMLQTTLVTIVTLAQLAMGGTATKFAAEYRTTNPKRAGQVLGIAGLLTLVAAVAATVFLLAGSPWLAEHTLRRPDLAGPLMIGVGYLFFSTVNGFQIGALSGLEDYKGLAISGVLTGTVGVAMVSFGAIFYGLNGALLGLSGTAISRCLFHAYSLRKELKAQGIQLTLESDPALRKTVFHFAFPAVISGYVLFPTGYATNAILFAQHGGQVEMAVFGAANNLRTLALFLPNVINVVGLAVLNHTMRNASHREYKKVSAYSTGAMVVSAIVAAVMILSVGPFLLKLFGKGFNVGFLPLLILLISTLPESLSMGFRQHIQSQSRMWAWLVYVMIPWQAVYLIATIILVPTHGAVGLAMAYMVSTFVYVIASGTMASRVKREAA